MIGNAIMRQADSTKSMKESPFFGGAYWLETVKRIIVPQTIIPRLPFFGGAY